MTNTAHFEIFLSIPPGLERAGKREAKEKGFENPKAVQGGVVFQGGWEDVWCANLTLRSPSKILARIGEFRVVHLAQLDKKARQFPWGNYLHQGCAIRVDATCRRSKIYHEKAVKQRFETALKEEFKAQIDPKADIKIQLRIEDNICIVSLDTSGELLHKRGNKQALNKAPMRENLAALFLGLAKFNGEETVLDPMCGSGTFILEAAEMASGLYPGRNRSFAFEYFKSFNEKKWQQLKQSQTAKKPDTRFFGSDKDAGAIRISKQNAQSADIEAISHFENIDIEELVPPDCAPGLVIANPPYGARIGNMKQLHALYALFGLVMKKRFQGWRIAIITNEQALADATKLSFTSTSPIIDHGGIKVKLYVYDPQKAKG